MKEREEEKTELSPVRPEEVTVPSNGDTVRMANVLPGSQQPPLETLFEQPSQNGLPPLPRSLPAQSVSAAAAHVRKPSFDHLPRPGGGSLLRNTSNASSSIGMPELGGNSVEFSSLGTASSTMAPPPTAAPPGHQRNVSWADAPPLSPGGRRERLFSQGSRRKLSNIDFKQINPLETEAETYIIEALEQRDRSDSHGNNSYGALNVPTEVISNMSALDEQESMTEHPEEHHSRPKLMKQPSTMPRRHKRTQTMEQRLGGLASALDAMHAEHVWEGLVTDISAPVSPTQVRTNTLESSEPVLSSADAFQQNASLLYHQANEDVVGGGSSVDTNKGASNWKKARNVLLVQRMHQPSKESNESSTDENNDSGESGGGGDAELGVINEGSDEGNNNDKKQEKVKYDPKKKVNRKRTAMDFAFARDVSDFVKPIKSTICLFVKVTLFYLMIPATGIAAILYYWCGNPPVGILKNNGQLINGTLYNTNDQVVDPATAAISWWLIFICVRQLITFAMAQTAQIIFIDFLSIKSRFSFKVFGAWATLFILQSRGWPFVLFFWAVFDFALLSGARRFSSCWLYWQTTIGLFSEQNPSGHVVDSEWNYRVLGIALGVAAVVTVKRFLLGLYLGKKTFIEFSDKLEGVMRKILLISEVGALARAFEREERYKNRHGGTDKDRIVASSILSPDRFQGLFANADDDTTPGSQYNRSQRSIGYNDVGNEAGGMTPVIDPTDRHPLTGKLSPSQKARMAQMLGTWEEPMAAEKPIELVSVDSLLQFRRAMACLRTDFPFSGSFGPAKTREETVVSSQDVFYRLMLRSDDDEYLNFEVLALLGALPDGSLDQPKLIDLIKLFRPDHNGKLKMVDFVKSVDTVYRDLRMLRASVNNSSKIDRSFENIFNVVFYAIILTIILSVLGYDPLALFLSVSGVVLSLAFMSKYLSRLVSLCRSVTANPLSSFLEQLAQRVASILKAFYSFWLVAPSLSAMQFMLARPIRIQVLKEAGGGWLKT